jgi:hypothetical protein
MPEYESTFNKSFDQVSDERALYIKDRIHSGERFVVMWSGGIDSTVVLVALLKNLNQEELTSVVVCASAASIIEHPIFWERYIHNKLQVIDGAVYKYDDLIERGLVPISADDGDSIFGTVDGLSLYQTYDSYLEGMTPDVQSKLKNLKSKISSPDVHYDLYKELIIKYLQKNNQNLNFGRLLYEKYNRSVKTAPVPIQSLHDFFWWGIFDLKVFNCSVRGALYYNDRVEWRIAIHTIVNWFNSHDYQRWSMVNNNNGQKIRSILPSYKIAAKDYIWSFDKNDWYKHFKIKLHSLHSLVNYQDISKLEPTRTPVHRVGLTTDYTMLYANDPGVKDFFQYHLDNYIIDWTEL